MSYSVIDAIFEARDRAPAPSRAWFQFKEHYFPRTSSSTDNAPAPGQNWQRNSLKRSFLWNLWVADEISRKSRRCLVSQVQSVAPLYFSPILIAWRRHYTVYCSNDVDDRCATRCTVKFKSNNSETPFFHAPGTFGEYDFSCTTVF
jgi:hypothetical protein